MQRRALIIGINEYPFIAGKDLFGCRNDAMVVRSLLIERFDFPDARVRTLLDGEATRDGVLGALQQLVDETGDEDHVVIFYAGHGSRLVDPEAPGAIIEGLVPTDSGRGEHPSRDILDREIDVFVRQLNALTPYVTLLFDCCHAGSVTRDAFGTTRSVEADLRDPTAMGHPLTTAERRAGRPAPPGTRSAVLIAACQAEELANEHKGVVAGEPVTHGALTWHLVRELRAATPGTTWRGIFERVAPTITAAHRSQHPHIEGNRDQEVFGRIERPPAPYLPVRAVSRDQVMLGGGAVHDVVPDARWTIRPAGALHATDGEAVARVVVTQVRAAEAIARVEEGDPTALQPGMRAFAEPSGRRIEALRVATDDPQAAASIARSDRLEVAPRSRAGVLVQRLPARTSAGPGDPCPQIRRPLPTPTWAAVGADGRLVTRLQPDGPGAIAALVGDLEGMARYRSFLQLENRDPASALRGAIRVEVLVGTGDPLDPWRPAPIDPGTGHALVHEGDAIEVVLHNTHAAQLHVTLLDFQPDGAITSLLPWADYGTRSVPIAPGTAFRVAADHFGAPEGLTASLPEGFPWTDEPPGPHVAGLDVLKALVTFDPAEISLVAQPPVRSANPTDLELLTDGLARGSRLVPPPRRGRDQDWAASTAALRIVRREHH